MRKAIVFLTLAALILCTGTAFAQYSGPWTYDWDLNTGIGPWVLGNNGTANGTWYAPGTEPMLPDGGYSKSNADGIHGGTLHLPDKSYAKLDVTSLNLGYSSGRAGFVFQADVYAPNLQPLGGFPFGYPGNFLQAAGIGAGRSDGKENYLEGEPQKYGNFIAKDSTWDNTNRRTTSWIVEGTGDMSTWWDKWVTMQIDFGYTTPGKWTSRVYVPWDSPVGTAGWYIAGSGNYDLNPNIAITYLRIGGGYSWTQAEYDNVRLAVAAVPEPSSMLALASGLFGMAGFVIRRKK